MTKQKAFKERIRTRMDKTGESYTTARQHLIEKSTQARKSRAPKTIAPISKRNSQTVEHTGRTCEQWYSLLDKWGAMKKKHPEIVRHLIDKHKVDGWWAQTITGGYEQERGLRVPGQRADGTFSVSATKTIATTLTKAYDSFADEDLRSDWLGDFKFDNGTGRRGKSLTGRCPDATRLAISFDKKANGKVQVAVAHEKIYEPEQADEMKAFWRERLGDLKQVLEA